MGLIKFIIEGQAHATEQNQLFELAGEFSMIHLESFRLFALSVVHYFQNVSSKIACSNEFSDVLIKRQQKTLRHYPDYRKLKMAG